MWVSLFFIYTWAKSGLPFIYLKKLYLYRQSCRLPDSVSRGVVFRLRISPQFRSYNQNSLKPSVRDLCRTGSCKNPRKSASLPCPSICLNLVYMCDTPHHRLKEPILPCVSFTHLAMRVKSCLGRGPVGIGSGSGRGKFRSGFVRSGLVGPGRVGSCHSCRSDWMT
jgi:hypothetical protein